MFGISNSWDLFVIFEICFLSFFLAKKIKTTPYFIYIYLDNLNFLLFILEFR